MEKGHDLGQTMPNVKRVWNILCVYIQFQDTMLSILKL